MTHHQRTVHRVFWLLGGPLLLFGLLLLILHRPPGPLPAEASADAATSSGGLGSRATDTMDH